MYKSLYIILFLFAASGVQAQQLPERSLVRKGNRQYNKGNYEQSAGHYEQALQAAPGQFEAIYNLGNALYKAERFDRAEQTMQQAAADSLRADTERAEAFYNLGNAQFKQQKYQEALESYKQSLRLNPSDMEAKYNYAYTKRLLDENKVFLSMSIRFAPEEECSRPGTTRFIQSFLFRVFCFFAFYLQPLSC